MEKWETKAHKERNFSFFGFLRLLNKESTGHDPVKNPDISMPFVRESDTSVSYFWHRETL